MRPPRRNKLIASRRRTDEDGEDEGSVAGLIDDDSSSQASVVSDVDNDADADGESSGYSDAGTQRKIGKKKDEGDELRGEGNGQATEPAAVAKMPSFFASMADTEAMMNGMKITGRGDHADEINFDDTEEQQMESPPAQSTEHQGLSALERTESLGERRRREHEEYKKKRDEDPAFVPNRGGFFMHDHRTTAPGQNGFRPSGRGRGGRGRGIGGPVPPIM